MKHLKINTPHIVHETFSDDEAAIINLKTGNYYSLNPTGAEIWSLIEKNATSEQIIDTFGKYYKSDNGSISESVNSFVKNLIDEELVKEFEYDSMDSQSDLKLDDEKEYDKFEEPSVERFADMQELLLLDPIHDVEEAGFPHKKGD